MPSLSVVHTVPSKRRKRRAGALLAAEADGAVDEAGHEPLEADRHLPEASAERLGDPVDHRARHEGLADRGIRPPVRAVREEVLDRDGEVVVGVHEAAVGRDDAVPVGVGVVAGEDVEARLRARAPTPSRDGRRRVHADLAVPVERHERPRRVDARVHDGEVEAVAVADRRPVVHGCPAQRVGADADAAALDGVEVDDVREVVDVVAAEVVGLDAARLGLLHLGEAARDELVGAVRRSSRSRRSRPGRRAAGCT